MNSGTHDFDPSFMWICLKSVAGSFCCPYVAHLPRDPGQRQCQALDRFVRVPPLAGSDLAPSDTTLPGCVVVTNLDSSRREIDRDPSQRPEQPTRQHGGAHPVARLVHGGVGQADHREARESAGDVDLDGDGTPDRAAQRGGGDRGEHAGERSHRFGLRCLPCSSIPSSGTTHRLQVC